MAEPRYELEWTELSKKDYDSLDGSEKVVVDKGLTRIRMFGMEAGEPLSGRLSSCRKIKHRKKGLRIVFRRSGTGAFAMVDVGCVKGADDLTHCPARAGARP